MRQRDFKTWIAFGLVSALLGCTVPVGTQWTSNAIGTGQTEAHTQAGVGGLGLGIRWPDSGSSLQAIPNRAIKAVVTLTRADGSQAIDSSGKAIAPVEIYRQADPYYYGPYPAGFNTYGSLRWDLPVQADLLIQAEVRDAQNQVVASDEKRIDVVPGLFATVGMELVAVDAPVITSLSKSDWRVGDRIIVAGSGFGKSKNWKTLAYVGLNYQYLPYSNLIFPMPVPSGGFGMMRRSLPETAVTVDSDTQLTLTVPHDLLSGFADYFTKPDKLQPKFMVMVDGVTSRSIDFSMPTQATASLDVELIEVPDAPPQNPTRWVGQDLWKPPFEALPLAAGTRWNYLVSTTYTYPQSQGGGTSSWSRTMRVEMLDDDGRGQYESYSYSTLRAFDLANGSASELSPIFRLSSTNGIQTLPEVTLNVPALGQRLAKHYFTSPESGVTREVWLVEGVGVVRSVETRVGGYHYSHEGKRDPLPRQRQVTTYELIDFTPAAPSEEG